MSQGTGMSQSGTGSLGLQDVPKKNRLPSLTLRLTGFHGTRVPVMIVFFLSPTEARILSRCDHFWKRIFGHTVLWKGLHCRDFYSVGCGGDIPVAERRCVWVQMMGRSGKERCLWHLAQRDGPEFAQVCKSIAAIPGRSKQELLEAYKNWMQQRLRNSKEGNAEPASTGAPEKIAQDPTWEHSEKPTFGVKTSWEKYGFGKDWARAMGFPAGPHRQAQVDTLLNNAVGPKLASQTCHDFRPTVSHCHSLSYRHATTPSWK